MLCIQASNFRNVWHNRRTILNEQSPFAPKSPYAVSKLAAHNIGQNYRDAYGLKVFNGILFNHESELRAREFVTQSTLQLCEIAGKREFMELGNLNSVRDWGYAGDYVIAMEMMMKLKSLTIMSLQQTQ